MLKKQPSTFVLYKPTAQLLIVRYIEMRRQYDSHGMNSLANKRLRLSLPERNVMYLKDA